MGIEVLRLLLWPLVRFSVRHSLSYKELTSVAKGLFVEAAELELKERGEKITASRLGIIAGVSRNEIAVLRKQETKPTEEKLGAIARIVARWEQDKHYRNRAGKPRTLTYKGEDSEFYRLVQEESKHLNPKAVVLELIRRDVAERSPRGLKLKRQVESAGDDESASFSLLAKDLESLISSVEENASRKKSVSNLHIRTEYDNIYQSEIPTIRSWLLEEGKAFHKRARDYISQFDKDINQRDSGEAGGRVVVTAFSLSEPFETDSN